MTLFDIDPAGAIVAKAALKAVVDQYRVTAAHHPGDTAEMTAQRATVGEAATLLEGVAIALGRPRFAPERPTPARLCAAHLRHVRWHLVKAAGDTYGHVDENRGVAIGYHGAASALVHFFELPAIPCFEELQATARFAVLWSGLTGRRLQAAQLRAASPGGANGHCPACQSARCMPWARRGEVCGAVRRCCTWWDEKCENLIRNGWRCCECGTGNLDGDGDTCRGCGHENCEDVAPPACV